MYCLRCGKDTTGKEVFCSSCLEVMEKYPVPSGTPIVIHRRAALPKKAPVKKKLSPEEQVIRQRKTIRWLTVALVCSILMLGLSIALLFDIMPEEEAKVTIGQNYVTRDTANHE